MTRAEELVCARAGLAELDRIAGAVSGGALGIILLERNKVVKRLTRLTQQGMEAQ